MARKLRSSVDMHLLKMKQDEIRGPEQQLRSENQTIVCLHRAKINLIDGGYTNCFARNMAGCLAAFHTRFRTMNWRDYSPERALSVELFQHECFASILVSSFDRRFSRR